MESGGRGCGVVGVESMALALAEAGARASCSLGASLVESLPLILFVWCCSVAVLFFPFFFSFFFCFLFLGYVNLSYAFFFFGIDLMHHFGDNILLKPFKSIFLNFKYNII